MLEPVQAEVAAPKYTYDGKLKVEKAIVWREALEAPHRLNKDSFGFKCRVTFDDGTTDDASTHSRRKLRDAKADYDRMPEKVTNETAEFHNGVWVMTRTVFRIG